MRNSLQLHGGQAIQENPHNHRTVNNNQIVTELTCELCIEPFPADQSFSNNNNCFHPFCLDCIAKYIQVKLEDNVADIPCPDLNCNHLLDPLFCRQYISKPVFDKWCDLLCDSAVLRVKQRCYCPNRKCSALVLNECRPLVKAKCPNCKKNFCFKCQSSWHSGFRCNESGQPMDENDVLFQNILEWQGWRRCPNCGQCVERIDGCNLIRCRCHTVFCYNCGERPHMGSCEANLKIPRVYGFWLFLFFILTVWGVWGIICLLSYPRKH